VTSLHSPLGPPQHVAIVMDGNGRWAQLKGQSRTAGHKKGAETLAACVRIFAQRGVKILTVYAFSTENWRRPAGEVSSIMALVPKAIRLYLPTLNKAGVRVRVVGDIQSLPLKTADAWRHIEQATQSNQAFTLLVAFNYGGRWDIVQACQQLLAQQIPANEITEEKLANVLALHDYPDPDLLIRTGGETRLSNFLLWQLAYAELFFTSCLWPDFGELQIDEALAFYARKQRRFGALAENEIAHP
jgi:undecaprenyl diphosphate synthase